MCPAFPEAYVLENWGRGMAPKLFLPGLGNRSWLTTHPWVQSQENCAGPGTGQQNGSGASLQTRGKTFRTTSTNTIPRAPQFLQEVSSRHEAQGTHPCPAFLSSCSPPWLPWSSTTHSTPCPLWTDTAVAGCSPACSSPPGPDAKADCTQPLPAP